MSELSGSSYRQLIDRKGIIYGHLFDAAGQVHQVGWSRLKAWSLEARFMWLHLDRNDRGVRAWLAAEAGLEPAIRDALLAEEPLPHRLVVNDGLLVFLRGVNLNREAGLADLVTARLWIESGRALSLRGPRLQAAQDLHDQIRGYGQPDSPGDFLVAMVTRLLDWLGVVLEEMEDQLDSLEVDLLDNALNQDFRSTLRRLRRQSIALRRYIAPQSEVIRSLAYERVSWLSDSQRTRLRDLATRNLRFADDLGAIRERIIVIDEELSVLNSEQINRTVFVLSMVTAIFLPLSFITGLLGINVGGIPGTHSEWGFVVVCIILSFIVALELFFFYYYLKKRQF